MAEKLSRIAAAAYRFRQQWEALPEVARAIATDSFNDAIAALRTVQELPPEVLDAATAIGKEAIGIWLKPFSSTAAKVAKLRTACDELPPDLGNFLAGVLDSMTTDGGASE